MSQLPSDKLRRRTFSVRSVAIGAAFVAVVAAGSVGAAFAAPHVFAQPTPTVTVVPHTAATLSPDELAGVQQGADAQQAQIQAEAAAKAAADAAAAQAAADAANAAKRAPQKQTNSEVAPKCPAGSTHNEVDANGNDVSCFPDQCFHLTLPDPAHPECDVAFKP